MQARTGSPNGHDRSVGEDFRRGREEAREVGRDISDLTGDIRYLVQKEAELARAEVMEAVSNTVRTAIWAGVALVIANALLLFAFVTVMLAFDTFLALWLSALITTGIILLLTLIAAGMAYFRLKRISFKPQRTIDSINEDMQWARNQIKSSVR